MDGLDTYQTRICHMLFLGQAIGHVNGQLPAQGTCDNLKATSPHQQQKSVLNLYFWYSKIVQYFFQVMFCLVCCLCQVQAAWKGSCLEVSDKDLLIVADEKMRHKSVPTFTTRRGPPQLNVPSEKFHLLWRMISRT